jgi:phosphoenolpyruvate carboxykinase (GTP)
MKNIAPAVFPPNGIGDAKPDNQAVLDWVHEIGTLTNPENIFWCDGSNRENEFLLDQAMRQGVLLKLNQKKVPRSYLHRSNPGRAIHFRVHAGERGSRSNQQLV